MYTAIGVRELRDRASRIVRSVREDLEQYVITVRGEPVAVIRPLTTEDRERLRSAEVAAELAEMRALARAVADGWTSDKSGVELVSEQRR